MPMHTQKDKNRSHGLSLPELLTVVVIIAALTAVGLPSTLRLVRNEQLASTTNELLTHIQLARHSAAQYRTIATLCPVPARPTEDRCGSNWNAGYRVFADRNGDAALNLAEDTLIAQTELQAGVTVTWRSFRRLTRLQFDATGITRALNGTFVLCGAGTPPLERKIVVNLAGRARIQRYESGTSPDC